MQKASPWFFTPERESQVLQENVCCVAAWTRLGSERISALSRRQRRHPSARLPPTLALHPQPRRCAHREPPESEVGAQFQSRAAPDTTRVEQEQEKQETRGKARRAGSKGEAGGKGESGAPGQAGPRGRGRRGRGGRGRRGPGAGAGSSLRRPRRVSPRPRALRGAGARIPGMSAEPLRGG